ncbi:hypothetical protein ABBQ38_005786 [Trebouxia sp. C0009 RCD-2024]
MLIGSLKKGKLQLDIWQPGQGPWSEQLKRRLDALITRYQLPHRELPSYSVIQKLDGSLANAISCYKRDERAAINALRNTWMTGQQLWAQDVGYHLSATRQYPNGHWQVLDNCTAAVQECLLEYDGDGTPPQDFFAALKPGMVDSINRAHRKVVGSWEGFMKLCNLRPLKVAPGSWTVQRVDSMLLQYVAATNTPHLMPTTHQMLGAKACGAHPHCETAVALSVAIIRHGGGGRATAARLGLKLQAYEHITSEERELLASCFKQNPCLPMAAVTQMYNNTAANLDLQKRNRDSLSNMLARSSEHALQLIKCSRALGLNTAASMQQLRILLQTPAIGGDVVALRQNAKLVRRLCKTAEISVFEALELLPGPMGSKDWVQTLLEQCEIETEVQFWRGAFCKKFHLPSASMVQVWDQTDELKDFRANRFKLTLTESLAVVFQKLAKQALDAGILSQTWLHHSSQKNTELKSDAAHYRIQMLQFQSQIKSLSHTPHVSNILLVKSEDGLVHDPKVLPVLPPCFDDLWTDGPLSDKARPHWSKFHLLSFETAQSLLRQAGSCGGVYQMWLSRRERQTNGSYKTVMRTELYVGSATVLMSRVACYAPATRCGPPGPRWEVTKALLFQGVWELGFDIEIRFLQLDGMTLPQIRQVEEYYLHAAKWPWNKIHNGNIRTHPEWQDRLLSDTASMLGHLSDYEQDDRRKQGLTRLGAEVHEGSHRLEQPEAEVEGSVLIDEAGYADTDTDSEMHLSDAGSDIDSDDDQPSEETPIPDID